MPNLVELDDRRVATVNLTPGRAIHREPLLWIDGREIRVMDPRRSKLAAMFVKGARTIPFGPKYHVLYLGAANGTTASHVSDLVPQGRVYCVEFSARSFRDLLNVCEPRANMIPIMGDAGRPDRYAAMVERVDTLYMDVSQRNQAEIFLKNVRQFRPRHGILMVKSRSIDVAREPKEVYAEVRAALEAEVRVV
ncbi:MAG TPA: fibrillarin-like rRNA/tRNA 2'-O-methyltransferase, partial [Burkholderiales bacterium]|nr:fibrillarin-like rRNA/tRNA 2'-O-methyltransferase [Burkholderiales bacterium]